MPARPVMNEISMNKLPFSNFQTPVEKKRFVRRNHRVWVPLHKYAVIRKGALWVFVHILCSCRVIDRLWLIANENYNPFVHCTHGIFSIQMKSSYFIWPTFIWLLLVMLVISYELVMIISIKRSTLQFDHLSIMVPEIFRNSTVCSVPCSK